MKTTLGMAIAGFALASASASTALAQQTQAYGQQAQTVEREPSYARTPVRAPMDAFELGVNTGYSQGFGRITGGAGNRIGDIAGPGIGAGLLLGYRASPSMMVGISSTYQEFSGRQASTAARGMSSSVELGWHFQPFQRVDPWLNAGAGYRMLWEMPAGRNNDVLLHGFELAKLKVGVDIRASQDVAVGPFVGADLNMFVWRNPEGPGGNVELRDKRVNTFVYAGMQGRFDLGGARVGAPGSLRAGR